jgi:ubiquinone/menaquinone biosynthesis C-methylase UbiE
MAEPIDYDQQQFAVYARGRALPPETIDTWMQAFARRVAPRRPLSVLDLGSGTGRFTPALADTFGGPVHGVEPAARMREIAEASASHPNVTYLAGTAERIPLPDGSCDLVLMYLSFHHVQDREAAAREIARVLRPSSGARVLVRSTFADRMPGLLWHRYFPAARAIEEDVFPSVAEVERIFAAVGLRRLALDQVRHRMAPSLAEYASRLSLRAVSTFEHMTENEIAEGFATLNQDAAAETEPRPIEEDCDSSSSAAPEVYERVFVALGYTGQPWKGSSCSEKPPMRWPGWIPRCCRMRSWGRGWWSGIVSRRVWWRAGRG